MSDKKCNYYELSSCGKGFFALIIFGLLVLSGIGFYEFYPRRSNFDYTENQSNTVEINCEDSNITTNLSVKEKKEKDLVFIIFLICDSLLLGLTLILFYLSEQKFNEHICSLNKGMAISDKCLCSKNCIQSVKNHSGLTKITQKDSKGNIKTEKEFYSSRKACVDLFKAYSNAITDL